jgi:hypothetical protein
VASAAWDGALRLWKVSGQKAPVATLRGDRHPLLSVAFSPDGARVAAGGLSGSAWVWDVHSHRLVAILPVRQPIWDIGFSRDGRLLVTAGDDGVARVFASESGRPIAELHSGIDHLEAAVFDPVRWRVAVAGERGEAPVERGEAAVLDCVECRSLEELVCRAADRLTPRELSTLPRDARDRIDSRQRRCHAGR